MKILAGFIGFLAALPLSGCMTAAEMATQQANEDDAYCVSIGATTVSNPYAGCRMMLTQGRMQQQMQADANSTALLTAGAAIVANQPQPAPVQPLPNILPQQTRCQSYGHTTNCTTY